MPDLSQIFTQLTAALGDLDAKRKKRDTASAALNAASDAYENALTATQTLKRSLDEQLAEVLPFPTSDRVRAA